VRAAHLQVAQGEDWLVAARIGERAVHQVRRLIGHELDRLREAGQCRLGLAAHHERRGPQVEQPGQSALQFSPCPHIVAVSLGRRGADASCNRGLGQHERVPYVGQGGGRVAEPQERLGAGDQKIDRVGPQVNGSVEVAHSLVRRGRIGRQHLKLGHLDGNHLLGHQFPGRWVAGHATASDKPSPSWPDF